METITTPILFIGAGNMAHAIYAGARAAGVLDDAAVGVLDPNAARRSLYPNAFEHAAEAIEWLGAGSDGTSTIVLAVKPQMLKAGVEPLLAHLPALGHDPLVISILAGTRIEQVRRAFAERARVIRVMPNTPARVGLGMSAIAPGPEATGRDIGIAGALLASVGEAITIPERLMDAFTALAGSGPAYLFYLAEAMMAAGKEMGFDDQQTGTIVGQTLLGSATLLSRSDELPGYLRATVTSKNGTTFAATTMLDERGVMGAIVDAVVAARDRGIELGREG